MSGGVDRRSRSAGHTARDALDDEQTVAHVDVRTAREQLDDLVVIDTPGRDGASGRNEERAVVLAVPRWLVGCSGSDPGRTTRGTCGDPPRRSPRRPAGPAARCCSRPLARTSTGSARPPGRPSIPRHGPTRSADVARRATALLTELDDLLSDARAVRADLDDGGHG